MTKEDKVVIACRVADLPNSVRSDAEPRPCSNCSTDTWTESTSRKLLSEGYRLLCVPCGRETLQGEIEWHPQTSGNVALGKLSPALKQFYDID